MQLGNQQASGNVEDRRGMGIGGGLGVGGIVVAVIAYFLGFDPNTAIQVGQEVGGHKETREAPKVINIMDALKKSMQAKGQVEVRDAVRKGMGKSAPKREASPAAPPVNWRPPSTRWRMRESSLTRRTTTTSTGSSSFRSITPPSPKSTSSLASEKHRVAETAPRERRAIGDFVYEASWGRALS